MTRPRDILLLLLVLPTVAGCLLEPFTGSDVTLELGTGTFSAGDIVNRPSEHYELFAVINQGVVSAGKFRIDDRLDAYAVPSEERIGVANQQGSSLPLGGIQLHTEVHLGDAEEVFLAIEENGETDAAPNGPVVGTAALATGVGGRLTGTLEGKIPTIDDRLAPLVQSRVTIITSE